MAKVENIDHRTHVGSDAWKERHDTETKRLSAWRRLHALLPHDEVVKVAKPTDTPTELTAVVKAIEAQQAEEKK